MLRRRHEDGEGSHRYRMRQKLVSFGDDYWIENGLGRRTFFDIAANADEVLILAITVVIDMMTDEGK